MKLAILAENDDAIKSSIDEDEEDNGESGDGSGEFDPFSVGISFPIEDSEVAVQNKWATLKLAQKLLMLMVGLFYLWILAGRRVRSKMQQQLQYQTRSSPSSLLTVYFSSNFTLIGLAIGMIILFIFSL